MQVCTSLQTDNHATSPLIFTGRMPFLLPNQQRQSTEGTAFSLNNAVHLNLLRYACNKSKSFLSIILTVIMEMNY